MDEKILKLDDVIWIGKLVDTIHTFLYKKQYYKATLSDSLLYNSEFGIILSKFQMIYPADAKSKY